MSVPSMLPNFEGMDKADIDQLLEEIDADCIEKGTPILSCVVVHDDGAPSTACMRSITKYNLRNEGETDAEVVDRLRTAASQFYKNTTD